MSAPAQPDRELAVAKYRREAPAYDRRTRLIDRYRSRAVQQLGLARGETVIDVACGTGASFEALEQRIGPQGRLIGIDVSPEMLGLARERTARDGWDNVTLIEASVDEVVLDDMRADAALFSFTHDVLQSPAAIENVLAHLRPGARVVAVGGKSPSQSWRGSESNARSSFSWASRSDRAGVLPSSTAGVRSILCAVGGVVSEWPAGGTLGG